MALYSSAPPWPAETESFDLPLYGDDRQAEARRAAAMNIELMEQMVFLSKCVGIRMSKPSLFILNVITLSTLL